MFDIKPHSVHLKLYRAREHFEALGTELDKFLKSRMEEGRDLERVSDVVIANEAASVPFRIPLIIGDCLQNMRSSLDYLVWELVKANGGKPGQSQMFPVCLTQEGFKEAKKNGRLKDVDPRASLLIEGLQPFNEEESKRSRHVLAVLDKLTNVNKHRHVIGTPVHCRLTPGDLPPLRFISGAFSDEPKGIGVVRGEIISYIAFEETAVQRVEVAAGIDLIFRFLVEQVFLKFAGFF
jgi:hypothetical protein